MGAFWFTKTWKTELKTLGLIFESFSFPGEMWFILNKQSDEQNVTYSLTINNSYDIPVTPFQGMILERGLKEYWSKRDKNYKKSLGFKWSRFLYMRKKKKSDRIWKKALEVKG